VPKPEESTAKSNFNSRAALPDLFQKDQPIGLLALKNLSGFCNLLFRVLL